MNHIIKGIIDFLLESLYPKRCAACDKVLLNFEKEIGFCRRCTKNIKLIGHNYCLKCGGPILSAGKEYCDNCSKTNHAFNQSKAIFRYTGDMKKSMYRFKYSNRRCYGKVYAKHAMKNYGTWIKSKGIEAIVPVPMYEAKKRRRGYNQAEVFAEALGELSGIPVCNGIVRREIDTVAMKQLNRVKRKKNLLKAFILAGNDVQFRKVLIVDDIYTTGSTLDEVARVLKDGGIKEVYGLCVCVGEAQ